MPSLIETADFIAGLRTGHIVFSPTWCSKVRNRRSHCRACFNACPHDALLWRSNTIHINENACTGCGACTAACPTQALGMRDPSYRQLIARIDAAPAEVLTFSCEQIQKAYDIDDASVITLPCLAALDEFTLVYAAHKGIRIVQFVSESCAECANAQVDEAIERTCDAARRIFEAWGMDMRLQRCNTFDALEGPESFKGGIARRNLIHELAEETKSTALAAATEIYKRHAEENEPPTLNTLLTDGEGLKVRSVPRNALALDCLFEQETHPQGQWETERFGTVQVDERRCRRCGLCGFMCPTGALDFVGEPAKPRRMGMPQNEGEVGHLEFRASDCANCSLCEDACPSVAIHVHAGVQAENLFDLEPITLN